MMIHRDAHGELYTRGMWCKGMTCGGYMPISICAVCELRVWFMHVRSKRNVADAPSRGDFDYLVRVLGARWIEQRFPELSLWLDSAGPWMELALQHTTELGPPGGCVQASVGEHWTSGAISEC